MNDKKNDVMTKSKNVLTMFVLAVLLSTTSYGQKILCIGDSNAARAHGWPSSLQEVMPDAIVVNKSISGNTIGFDNLGRESLNTLKNINRYLIETTGELAGSIPDIVIIGLGTNDCKAVYVGKHDLVVKNMNSLIDSIQDYYATGDNQPNIVLMTPPPMTSDSLLITKYKGGNGRIEKLVTSYRNIASEHSFGYIDLYDPLKEIFPYMTDDGVHLIPEAQIIVARYIKGYLNRKY